MHWKIKIINTDGTYWLCGNQKWSDDHKDGLGFSDEAEADKLVDMFRSKLTVYREPFKVKAIRFKGKASIRDNVITSFLNDQ
jgi:hypothetical protein